ncbi:phosphatidylinositol-3-phosphatase myotubularin-1 isoform X1 [Vigna radiata var. radiata]|uniref:phosphatidylinositol-3,5-bisphosphate 3-phosphatase n=3 Tax=Vigna radiata var. radiata TaxID=3916 RepID=A0A1S3V5Q9_VIGRR|nr:phosphatidylinositol-3-phosphatase myotubularin-1 isoform X1 [Vigna radiata var. radiata]
MDVPKHRATRTTSLRDVSDFSKMEVTGSWDALEWTKIEPITPFVSNANFDFLIESEQVVAEGHGVVLVNTDDAGTLMVTNFRLIFLSEGTRKVISLGTIPLATIEKFNKIVVKVQSNNRYVDKTPAQRLLQVIGKDMRILVFSFRPRTKQRRLVFDALLRCTKPTRLWDLYAFASGPSRFKNTTPLVRLLDEYCRLLCLGSYHASIDIIENGSFTWSNELWRISSVNSSYTMCQSYPFALVVPKIISDEEVLQASSFRARSRLPVVSWCHPLTGAVVARSSQPLVGIMMNMRSNMDEKLVAGLCSKLDSGSRRKLYIVDARPRKNALANGAMGGGSESSSNYFQSEVVFLGIDNIHAMRDSFVRLREYMDTHGRASSDGMSSFLRQGGSTWGGGNLSSMSASVSTLGDIGWLLHVQNVLAGAAWIAARVAIENSSVLVHCSDGWDRTSQLVSLANLLLDPYYRTFTGFQALVEKDWLAFGHPFSDRVGMPSVSGTGNMPFELSRQPSTGNFAPSPVHQSAGTFSSQPPASSHSHNNNNYSPIFLQWVDCVSQLLRMYPFAFQFSAAFLVDFIDCMLSCRFGNFLCNSEKERQKCNVFEACGCLWVYLADLRTSEGGSHVHYNPFYDPLKHNGALLPPAAALAPTLWPQFHLRWACPEEAQAGEIEAQCRKIVMKCSEMQKAKEMAERKVKEVTNSMESLNAELRREKQINSSAMNMAKSVSKENMAIKRAIQSMGCKVHVSGSGECTVDIESNPDILCCSSRKETNSNVRDDKTDPPISVQVTADDDDGNSGIVRVCETLCPFGSGGGGCRWPNGGCAQLGSQYVGLKANFDAFDQLSINDSYFKSE